MLTKHDVQVITTDLIGTCFDVSRVDAPILRAYGEQIKRTPYKPLHLPERMIDQMRVYPDVRVGLQHLQDIFTVCTLSNAPLGWQIRACKKHGIYFDGMIDLEPWEVYKPTLRAYARTQAVLGCQNKNVLMVTSNAKFGDLEAARQMGQQSILVDRKAPNYVPGVPSNFLELCELLT
jgi:FMN phosphatase YigB (HAD superfamily)